MKTPGRTFPESLRPPPTVAPAARVPWDGPARQDFQNFAHLTALGLQVPIVLISVFDQQMQQVVAGHGLEIRSPFPEDLGLCVRVLRSGEPLVVADTLVHPEIASLATMACAAGAPRARFYAGLPLIDDEGRMLGTVCAIDTRPRPDFDAARLALLQQAARTLSTVFARREQRLAAQSERQLFVRGPMAAVRWHPGAGWPLTYQSANLATLVGPDHAARLEAGAGWDTVALEADRELLRGGLASHEHTGLAEMEISFRIVLPGGELRWLRQTSCAERDEQGRVVALYGYLIDDTRLRRVEAGLASTQ